MPLGKIDAAISCVGNMRPSPEFNDFFGLSWDYSTMVMENGVVNGRIAEAAKKAGAERFVLVSASSAKKFAYGGALEGYIDGKEGAEAYARSVFGDENVGIVGPSLILGGGRLDGFAKFYGGICNSGGVRGGIKAWKAFKGGASTGYGPQDAVGEVSQTPPSHVDDVAKAVCACILDTIPSDQIETFKTETLEEDRIRGTNVQKEALGGYSFTYVDGYDQIKACAQKATPAVLASAVSASKTTGAADADDGESVKMDAATTLGQLWLRVPVDMRGLSIPISNVPLKSALSTTDPTIPWRSFTAKEFESFKVEGLRGDSIIDAGESEGRSRLDTRWYKVATTDEQSPSAYGAPNEGFLFGYRPFLYPWPPAAALFGFFAYACFYSYYDMPVQ